MKSLALFLALSATAFAEPNVLSPDEAKDGFKLLFDGKTLDGWRTYKQEKPKDKWQVKDGAITLTAGGGGDLITKEQFADFDLRWEWKIAPEGNSGLMWRVAEINGPPYKTGAEYQIFDSRAKRKYQNEITKGNIAGSLYDMIPAKVEWSKPAGEWNESRLVAKGSSFTFYLNGTKTVDLDMASKEWKDLLAKSKFATWDRFAKEPKGFICLQDHGDVVAFRSIRIKTL